MAKDERKTIKTVAIAVNFRLCEVVKVGEVGWKPDGGPQPYSFDGAGRWYATQEEAEDALRRSRAAEQKAASKKLEFKCLVKPGGVRREFAEATVTGLHRSLLRPTVAKTKLRPARTLDHNEVMLARTPAAQEAWEDWLVADATIRAAHKALQKHIIKMPDEYAGRGGMTPAEKHAAMVDELEANAAAAERGEAT